MRSIMLLIALASPLHAEPIRLWIGGAVLPASDPFRFGIESDIIELTQGAASFVVITDANKLFDRLTDGIADQVTYGPYTVPENYFLGEVRSDPFSALCSYPEFFDANTIDLSGWIVDRIEFQSIPRDNGLMLRNVQLYARLPEPSTMLILLVAIVSATSARFGQHR